MPVTDFDVLRPQGTPPIAAAPADNEAAPVSAPPFAPPASKVPTTRKRRAYQVWERASEPAGGDGLYRWCVLSATEGATSRSVAIRQATGGRAGTFATVLVGEFVEETVDDANALLADELAKAMQARFSDQLGMEVGLDEFRSAALEAVSAAAGES